MQKGGRKKSGEGVLVTKHSSAGSLEGTSSLVLGNNIISTINISFNTAHTHRVIHVVEFAIKEIHCIFIRNVILHHLCCSCPQQRSH